MIAVEATTPAGAVAVAVIGGSRAVHQAVICAACNRVRCIHGAALMLEDSIDPQPAHEQFARFLGAQTIAQGAIRGDTEAWARNWNDQESIWGNLRDIRHWIDRARQ
jgi:hypothetical protein